jgi:Uma2 family endonuclease
MTMLIADPWLEEQLREQRKACGGDHHDEVWEGVYFMAPLPNDEHQDLVMSLGVALHAAVAAAGLGKVRPGVNLAGRREDWERDYRAPDVVVFLKTTKAKNYGTFWCGAADFVVEIASPGDRSHEKISFYSRLGVVELLIVNRDPWSLELFRQREGRLEKVGEVLPGDGRTLTSTVVPLEFRLLAAEPRPQIEAVHTETRQQWIA